MSKLAAVVPKSQKEFTDPRYWKKFFEKHESTFEWYGDYQQLSPIFDKYIKPSDTILENGCGNSALAEQLYDNGFRKYRGIDTDAKVIKMQKDNQASKRPELVFECRSVAENGSINGSVNVIIDKGTLDALLPPDYTEDGEKLVTQNFDEVDRSLAPLGRYIVITLAQSHIICKLIAHFHPRKKYLIRVQKCEFADRDVAMPVFAIVITKLKIPMPILPSLEFSRHLMLKTDRVNNVDELMGLIESEQELNWFTHHVSKNSVEEAAIQICDKQGAYRYELIVVDNMDAKVLDTYAVFIVPLGRESDWVFATKKGRKILRKDCEKSRVVVVRLFRDQFYKSLEEIQNELSDFVISLKPLQCTETDIAFLSMGGVDVKETVATGTSEISGSWAVEQVTLEGMTHRRLVFLGNRGLVQSEVEVTKNKRGKWQIKSDILSCDHHRTMLTAIDVVDRCIGVGGGLLLRFLFEKFLKAQLVGVELDPDVVVVAQKYFGLPHSDERLKFVIQDALIFLQEVALEKEKQKFDVIFVDLSGQMADDGLSCPPAAFVVESSLVLMRECLNSKGCLAFNLVTRDEEVADRVKSVISKVFPAAFVVSTLEDVNEVIICPLVKQEPSEFISRIKESQNELKKKEDKEWIKSYIEDLERLSLSKCL
uniref:Methyltransferase type 11 domain-containing protein n=1 Tax=Ditylenchus dipsaci TaxID=166011 RepID=A0A915CRL1_9BILA